MILFLLAFFAGIILIALVICAWAIFSPATFIPFWCPGYRSRIDFRRAVIYRKGQPPEYIG